MPELPEVETIRRDLQERLPGLIIKNVVVQLPKSVRTGVITFKQTLAGATVARVERRAKLLFFHFATKRGSRVMVVHLKMTGQLVLTHKKDIIFGGHPILGAKTLPNAYTRATFHFTNGDILYFNDLRQFGYLKLVTEAEAAAVAKTYGLEPLESGFALKAFLEICERRKGANLKAMLLDQAGIAGIGNIYADEACFRAKVDPHRRVGSLAPAERKALWRAIRSVLALSVKHRGTTFNTYLNVDGRAGKFWRYRQVYGRKGEPCRRCGAILKKDVVAGRGTVWCPDCQK